MAVRSCTSAISRRWRRTGAQVSISSKQSARQNLAVIFARARWVAIASTLESRTSPSFVISISNALGWCTRRGDGLVAASTRSNSDGAPVPLRSQDRCARNDIFPTAAQTPPQHPSNTLESSPPRHTCRRSDAPSDARAASDSEKRH
eukprot:scaffold6070_cov295-Pinguiococcus_pyrenoidosus.AAC.7